MLIVQPFFRRSSILKSYCGLRYQRKQFYVTQKQIDKLKEEYHQDTYLAKAKIILGVVKLMCTHGYHESKADYKIFKEIGKKSRPERTEEEIQTYRRIKQDFIKAIPAFMVLFAPGGGPLFLLYLKLFPNFTPTWILTESIYKRLEKLQSDNRIIAQIYFKNMYNDSDFLLLAKKIAKDYLEAKKTEDQNENLRMISQLLMGFYQDGTYYLNKHSLLKRWSWKYFIFRSWSQWLMRQRIDRFVRSSLIEQGRHVQKEAFQIRLQQLLFKNLQEPEQPLIDS